MPENIGRAYAESVNAEFMLISFQNQSIDTLFREIGLKYLQVKSRSTQGDLDKIKLNKVEKSETTSKKRGNQCLR